MITALTIGLGIDYSIHVWRKFEANRETGMGIFWASMRDMYATTGSAPDYVSRNYNLWIHGSAPISSARNQGFIQ